jgi:two-component system sensor histidine kinase EvgS
MTAREIQNVFVRWSKIVDVGTPTLGVILYYYWCQLLIFTVLFLLLLLAVRSAIAAKKRAQRSEADKSAFLVMMSHEIRTPMNALIASLELLRNAPPRHKRQQYTELAFSSSQNLLELLNNVLDHSKLSLRQQKLELRSFDVGELLDVMCESQRPAAESKHLSLNLALAPGLRGT